MLNGIRVSQRGALYLRRGRFNTLHATFASFSRELLPGDEVWRYKETLEDKSYNLQRKSPLEKLAEHTGKLIQACAHTRARPQPNKAKKNKMHPSDKCWQLGAIIKLAI